ncbi:hypothetical protein SLEP1_g37312 [Rubroshorea leprosula]|uniref:Lipoyl-binding domain-containing protein n=1 Tax=Rubroshorea leprosula TaxID=152421 RepID=A0AAV5KUF6_9ROSI|nr:hypothetical protein SLEP1_g37312 [Rubroshorea leprosula]
MESSAALRSFHCPLGTVSQSRFLHERPATVHVPNGNRSTLKPSHVSGLVAGGKPNSSLISCVKTPESTVTAKTSVSSDDAALGSLEKKTLHNVTFPSGFEELMLEVCDETDIAELKMKIGDFEMHLKRNVGATKAPLSNIPPTTAPPIPTKPMNESAAEAAAVAPSPPPPPKSSPEKITPFANVSFGKSSKLAALEASGASNYVLVSSPTVGSFRRGRTIKGKIQPPMCKEGNVIKEGQVIGYLDQFGTQFPVRSDVAGEVLKLLVDDGDAVGYGDPLAAVLPSFHGIE